VKCARSMVECHECVFQKVCSMVKLVDELIKCVTGVRH